jgi:hypothetical protein
MYVDYVLMQPVSIMSTLIVMTEQLVVKMQPIRDP